MKANWKTSLCGIMFAIPQILVLVWPDCPKEIMGGISGIFGMIGFFLSKDHNVTGGTIDQNQTLLPKD